MSAEKGYGFAVVITAGCDRFIEASLLLLMKGVLVSRVIGTTEHRE
jgi:hypothetical protein